MMAGLSPTGVYKYSLIHKCILFTYKGNELCGASNKRLRQRTRSSAGECGMPKQVWPNDKRNSLEPGIEFEVFYALVTPLLCTHNINKDSRPRQFPHGFDLAPFSQALTGANVFGKVGWVIRSWWRYQALRFRNKQVGEFHKILHVLAQTFLGINSIWRISFRCAFDFLWQVIFRLPEWFWIKISMALLWWCIKVTLVQTI